MKRITLVLVALLLLTGCGKQEAAAPQIQLDERTQATATAAPEITAAPEVTAAPVQLTAAPEITTTPVDSSTPEPAPSEAGLVDALTARWAEEALLNDYYAMEPMDVLDLYGIDFAVCRTGAAYGDAAGYTNEAVVVEADKAVLDEVEALLQDHLEAVKAQFRGYDPAALALAEKAVLLREGDALLFIIGPNAEAMATAFRDLTK